ncbi:MAG: glycoside hydrolase family 97 protein [Thermoguttaceae bacterium]|nr:glycoside hydrolase family 97 protein [Thermoguttaceae bacterium]
MKRIRIIAIFALATFLAFVAQAPAQTIQTTSPNGKTIVTLNVGDATTYSATFDETTVLVPSKLGMTFENAEPLGAMKIVDSQTKTINEQWKQPLGKQAEYVDCCSETTVRLQETGPLARKLTLVIRAYDDGFAFRYIVPADSGFANEHGVFCIESEETEFAFDADYDAWATFYKKYNTSQEEEFPKTKLSAIAPDAFVGMPLVVKGNGFYAALTESDLLNWSGAQFAGSSDGAPTVKIRLTPRKDERGCVVRQGEAKSPWRVVLLGKNPVDLVNNSGIVLNTATPCAIDASWVTPGNSSWNWWAPQDGYPTDKVMRGLVDLAADMGWEYTLVDAGWQDKNKEGVAYTKDLNIPDLVKYAAEKNVRILLWFHYTSLVEIGERKALKQVADWGVAGVKIDFMDSHTQETVQWLEETCKIAAEYKLLVDYHGMYKPTGMERTYPNQITREGVRGNEYNRWSKNSATHTATLPFTRCMLGPADYTPGGFLNEHAETFKSLNAYKDKSVDCHVVGTRAHELALCMIYDSPLRCLADLPRNYKNQPGLEYLRDLPPVWDETIALDGQIGKFYVVARRSGENWRVSGITDEEARSFSISLDFLSDGDYEGVVYADSPESDKDATQISISTQTFHKGDVLNIEAVREGGWNVVLKKK